MISIIISIWFQNFISIRLMCRYMVIMLLLIHKHMLTYHMHSLMHLHLPLFGWCCPALRSFVLLSLCVCVCDAHLHHCINVRVCSLGWMFLWVCLLFRSLVKLHCFYCDWFPLGCSVWVCLCVCIHDTITHLEIKKQKTLASIIK